MFTYISTAVLQKDVLLVITPSIGKAKLQHWSYVLVQVFFCRARVCQLVL